MGLLIAQLVYAQDVQTPTNLASVSTTGVADYAQTLPEAVSQPLLPSIVPSAKKKAAFHRENPSLDAGLKKRGEGRLVSSSKRMTQPYRKELYDQSKSAIGTIPYRPSGTRDMVKSRCRLTQFGCSK